MEKTDFVVCTVVAATSVIIHGGIPRIVVYKSSAVHRDRGVPRVVVYTSAAVYTSAVVHTFAM
eukprot:7791738-Pyramimonas_sp.AAC.1